MYRRFEGSGMAGGAEVDAQSLEFAAQVSLPLPQKACASPTDKATTTLGASRITVSAKASDQFIVLRVCNISLMKNEEGDKYQS